MRRIRIRNKLFSVLVLTLIFLDYATMFVAAAGGTLNINFVAVNASDQPKELEIRQALPKELDAEDIKDPGDLKVQYDLDRKNYYVTGNIQFQPKESKTLKIKVNDVWYIQPDEIEALKTQLQQNVDTLKTHENYGAALEVQEVMDKQLTAILKQQQTYSENIERRIEEYRAYRQRLEEIKTNIYSMDYLRYQSKELKEIRDIRKTVKFLIAVSNPSTTDSRTITQKHILPDEIRAEDVVDAKGFDIRFDDAKNRAYLTKEETFAPGETKKYEVVLRDIWQFPMIKLQDLDDRSKAAQVELAGTIYESSAGRLITKIAEELEKIRTSEAKPWTSVENHIGAFRANNRRFDQAWKDFKRIEEMIAIVRAKKLEELSKGRVKNVLMRLKALRGLRALSEAIFKKALSVNTTWKIIFGSIIFVAIFTTIHFIIWARRSGKSGEEMAPKGREGIKVVPKPGEQEKAET